LSWSPCSEVTTVSDRELRRELRNLVLARKIREARPRAKSGDIFTNEAREAFRHTIRSAFRGPQAPNVRATIQQGAPLKETHVAVNTVYPDTVLYTTVPYTTVPYTTVPYTTVPYTTVPYTTVPYTTVPPTFC
jgi:hypothetical protein